MGTHMLVLNESFLMNTNMTRFKWFFRESLHPYDLDASSLSIGRILKVSLTCMFSAAGSSDAGGRERERLVFETNPQHCNDQPSLIPTPNNSCSPILDIFF